MSVTTHSSLTVETTLERLKLSAPFRISGHTFIDVPVAVAVLRDGVASGRGEAAGVYYLEDQPARMIDAIEAIRPAIGAGVSRGQLRELLPPGGARNALDCALWDLEAKRIGQPVWKLAGVERPGPLLTTFTLGAENPDAMAAGAKRFAQARALKLKLTGEWQLDADRIRAVRAARPDVWMGVDANQGFTPDTLDRVLPVLADSRVSLLEQPFARGREADLDGLKIPIPIAADESVQGLADIAGLVGRFNIVNIKLDKCGGLTEALLMAAQCRRLGLGVMVGNMVGSSLAMAPAFVLGQLCDFVDLDGPLFLDADRVPGVSYTDGHIWCPDEVWGAPVATAA